MPSPLSASKSKALGKRLADGSATADDWADFGELLGYFDDLGKEVEGRVRSALRGLTLRGASALSVAGRPGKTTSTIIQKIRRESRVSLANMQDLAGVRATAEMDRDEQDAVVAALVAAFPGDPRPPRTVDRRIDPRSGYRAVHVIVCVDGSNVEIQVRTYLQDLWANIFERLGDRLGRGIRYDDPRPDLSNDDRDLLASVQVLAERVDRAEQATLHLRSAVASSAAALESATEALRAAKAHQSADHDAIERIRALRRKIVESHAELTTLVPMPADETRQLLHETLRRLSGPAEPSRMKK